MSNLRKGSTIGGFEIITHKTKSLHTHDSSQIIGSGSSAIKDDGPGENLNVDGLDGYHFNDFEDNFINILGDEVEGNLLVDNVIESDPDSAINKKYFEDYIYKNNPTYLTYNPYVSIDSYSFDINKTNNVNIEIYSCYIFIKGREYHISYKKLDITNLSNINNLKIYVVIEYDQKNDVVDITLNKNYFQNTSNKYIIAEIITNSSGEISSIKKYEPYKWLKSHPIVEKSLPYGIIKTNNQGIIDRSWLQFKPSLTENISLDGPRRIISGGNYTYTITDYDVFSNYSVRITDGNASINGDTINISVNEINDNRHVTLTVIKNGNAVDFNIDFIGYLNNTTLNSSPPTMLDEIWKKTLENDGPEDLKYGDIAIDKEFNFLYLTGIQNTGSQYRFKVYKYDIYNNKWENLLNEPPQSDFFTAFCKMTVIGDYIYVIGGSNNYNDSSSNGLEASSVMFRINRYNTGFQKMNNLPINTIYHDVTTDGINHIYLVGGMESISNNVFNDYIYEYDINTDTWRKHSSPIPFKNSLKGHICEYYKGRIYVHGMNYSFDSDVLVNSNRGSIFWKYHIIHGSWKVINNNTDINKIFHNSVKHDDKFFIFGGEDNYEDKDHNFYEYYPEMESFQKIGEYKHYFEYKEPYDYPLGTDRYGYLYIYDYKENSLWRLI
ncbi:hypothetical protein PBI_SCTP2_142 [Salicola phage SCTP-2]|nr:hypothetical protein PBI_SCTP2_142 [Salicola phage SCTP-2]